MNRLERLLRPRSIAVVGGGAFGTNVVKQSLRMGFTGDIWPVHPSKSEVEGVRAYRTVAELPGAPDATFIGVNRNLTIEIVEQLGERGAGGAICFAAGFLETGDYDADGARLQQQLVAAAGDMPIIGPNCYGLINYADGALLWPDQHGGARLAPGMRGVGIITQSSNIACNITMQKRGLPIAFLMTAGNQAQTGLSEMALGLIEDERVSALGLHIEGFDSVAGFEHFAARARELKKPVVAMKVGRSEHARAATISHTASLAGSDAASEAFLKRLGIARVHTIPSLLEALKLLHAVGPIAGRRLSSMSCSGGEASVMADSAEGRGVHFPKLTEAHRAEVKETLGPLVAVANPLDYHTFIWNNEQAMTSTFTAMVSGGFDLNMLVLDFPRGDRCSDADWWPTVNAFDAALMSNAAKGAIVSSMGENLPEEHSAELLKRGIVPIHGIAEAFDAAEAAAFIGEAWARPATSAVFGLHGELAEGKGDKAPPPLTPPHKWEGDDRAQLDEAEAKALLAKAGLPVPGGRRATDIEEAVAAAKAIGFPVALKALGIAHKSEQAALKLNLTDEMAVRAAADTLSGLGNGLYVERMVAGGVAELIVGITRDPIFGPVMTIGSGGVLVELLKDSATLLLPASRGEIEAALRGLKLFPLLDGYRGRLKADIEAAVEAILGIADFAVANAAAIEELDINPLIACAEGQGAWIADALLVQPCLLPVYGEKVARRVG
ncbi:acetate--CoA ligase family protein [Mesorhizobium sp. BAC0120]|uniref:acetate--CoA ligase family protein n=1 Tax=Mesorhizobium sp. BAC0120 TaxID=3090670 RepID=UPI00298D116F|nr:acetate--CoA ligase family protein [Mesorhizobium sp. BAC0120]MDW6024939.1 acetate--CoA ligase family protein [Mesorhizobium sp. BAC0120]